ncbi:MULTISPECIES: growth/differentiation factor [unclassified Pseudactinotalea]|uniref:growth/differentiation factor n=1 Tax=unclassified Pseudactinotalea TaxID=2649176 RepID=UPI00128DB550|nr:MULTISPECIES: growth/differentiation factor [unclassified Pseudactinotalea]MPV49260.1 growth/differentiation factor [Pseudactinotalea sp. HY160]QGH69443.1 growth/differentiation factor [Pseudactinotalea sp. HY158]
MGIDVLAAGGQVWASGSSDGGGGSIGWVFFLAGFLYYGMMYLRYRNSDKRHRHELETEATLDNVQVADDYAGSLKGVSHSRMRGANYKQVEGAQNKRPW